MGIKEYIQQYIQDCRTRGLAPRTIEGYEDMLNDFYDFMLKERHPKIDSIAYKAYISHLVSLERKAGTIRLYSIILKGFYVYLNRKCEHPVNENNLPLYKASLPKIENIEKTDIERLIGSVKGKDETAKRNRAILHLLTTSGLRASEICNLNRRDILVNEEGNVEITVRGKGQKDRVAHTTDKAKRAIDMYLSSRTDSKEALFVVDRTRRIGRHLIWYIVKRNAKQVGLNNVSPHTLRHYTATELLRRGVNTSVVQKIMGHANISTTQRYTHITDRDASKVYNAVMG